MKKHTIIMAVIALLSTQTKLHADESPLILLDQIEAVVFGQEDVEIITKSDLDRPALSGGFRTMDSVIFERSVLLDAKKHKIPNDQESVDAGIEQMKRQHNLSDDDLENIFKESGYTVQEGRHEFQMMQMINTMIDAKVRSNLIVPRRDVEKYYNEHPEVVEATYTIERIFVPFSLTMTKTRQKKILQRFISAHPERIDGERFEFTLQHSEVAPHKQFIYDMKQGQMSQPEEITGGFEILRLVEKTSERLKSFDEKYREIVDILRRPKYEELMENYRDYLMKNVSIIYL